MATVTNTPTRRSEVNMTGKVRLYALIVELDNQNTTTVDIKTVYTLAPNIEKAIEYVYNRYSDERQLTATVKSVSELRIHDGLVMTA